MSALERMGGTPVETLDLHAFAYLSNALSPLWELEPLEASVLKDRTRLGPYYPELQRELEICVGEGLVQVVDLRITSPSQGEALRATFRLSRKKAATILQTLDALPDERQTADFLTELAAAFVDIREEKRDDAAALDAAYSDPSVPSDRLVDFGGQENRGNATLNATQALQRYAPAGVTLNRAEKLVMYVRLLKRRAHG